MALRLRLKSVAMSTWPGATAISLAACVAPTSTNDIERPLVSSGK
jgi:hypothetical protein